MNIFIKLFIFWVFYQMLIQYNKSSSYCISNGKCMNFKFLSLQQTKLTVTLQEEVHKNSQDVKKVQPMQKGQS